ncbi:MAG: hypothetical protein KC609_08860 [Myxococcales bacterium]|nr:hypothetical protein [Myxococcales bacterium]
MAQQDEYPFKASVRKAAVIFGVLLLVLVLPIPMAIYFFVKRGKGRVVVGENGLEVHGFGLWPGRWTFAEIERLGLLEVRMVGGGLGGALARQMNGGDVAVNLMAITRAGKKLKFVLSRYEKHEELMTRVVVATGLTPETLSMGLMGPKWPER